MVIDLYIRVSLVGIELLTIAARIVIASVDTYLRFAEAVNRLDISDEKPGLTELVGDTVESGMRKSTEDGVDDIGKAARSGPVDVAVEVPLTRTEAARGTDHGAD